MNTKYIYLHNKKLVVILVPLCLLLTPLAKASPFTQQQLPVSYSPDQLPRHWRYSHHFQARNNYESNQHTAEQYVENARIKKWGSQPEFPRASRRKHRPDYHMNGYPHTSVQTGNSLSYGHPVNHGYQNNYHMALTSAQAYIPGYIPGYANHYSYPLSYGAGFNGFYTPVFAAQHLPVPGYSGLGFPTAGYPGTGYIQRPLFLPGLMW